MGVFVKAGPPLWTFLNCQIFIWSLTAIGLYVVSPRFSAIQQADHTRTEELKRIEMLNIEVRDKLAHLVVTDEGTLEASLLGSGIFPEFRDRSANGLLTELLYLVKKNQDDPILHQAAWNAFLIVDAFERQCLPSAKEPAAGCGRDKLAVQLALASAQWPQPEQLKHHGGQPYELAIDAGSAVPAATTEARVAQAQSR